MNRVDLPPSSIPGLTTVGLTAGSEPLLQRFFEENPLYFMAVNGERASPDEAHEEIHDALPAGWPYTKKWVIGYQTCDGPLAAMANVVTAGDLVHSSGQETSTDVHPPQRGIHRVLISRYSREGAEDKENACFVHFEEQGKAPSLVYCERRRHSTLSGAVWVRGDRGGGLICVSACSARVPKRLSLQLE